MRGFAQEVHAAWYRRVCACMRLCALVCVQPIAHELACHWAQGNCSLPRTSRSQEQTLRGLVRRIVDARVKGQLSSHDLERHDLLDVLLKAGARDSVHFRLVCV